MEARESFDRVWGIRRGFEGLLTRQTVNLSSLSGDRLARLATTPSAGLGTSRLRPTSDQLVEILNQLDELNASALIGIGGNDTADSLDRLGQLAETRNSRVQVIGLPKTIDNDLAATDHSLGYPSAARYIAAYVRDTHLDALATASQYQVKFIEVMGRNAGWLAASSVLWVPASLSPPIVALPERPFPSESELLDVIERRVDADGFAVVVVPETMRWADGTHVSGPTPEWVDAFGHPYHASAGRALLRACSQHLGLRCRIDQPGSVSRASIDYASPIDLDEAVECGRFAVRSIADGASRQSIVINRLSSSPYESTPGLALLSSIANVEVRIPDEMIQPAGRQLAAAFFEYAMPLVGNSNRQYEIIDWTEAV
ncbi:6-phosphofructokinase [soil metagenome]